MKNEISVTLIHSQKNKMLFWMVVIIIAGIGFIVPEYLSSLFSVDLFLINITATLLCLIALIGASLSIRCAHCGLRLVWYALSKKGIGAWLDWLLHVKECPKCGGSSVEDNGEATK
jgi:hypothetical protein